jgi:hypothetical protein
MDLAGKYLVIWLSAEAVETFGRRAGGRGVGTGHEGKTKLTLRHSILESVAEREGTRQGWTEMMDRLAEELSHGGDRS